MQRSIKFRAWDGQSMFYDVVIDNGMWTDNIREDTWHDGNIMQYTGLKDKNGEEIYEGDILEWQYRRVKDGRTVKYISNGFWLVNCDGQQFFPSEPEVIGNIYENPELIEKK